MVPSGERGSSHGLFITLEGPELDARGLKVASIAGAAGHHGTALAMTEKLKRWQALPV